MNKIGENVIITLTMKIRIFRLDSYFLNLEKTL